jgi:asparagine synthase (glutamine-hydrolysing)
MIKEVFKPIWSDVQHVWTRNIFRDVIARHAHNGALHRPEDYVNHSLYFEAKTFLHGLLIIEDKISMAHGLESRVPFLDNDLVDFAMRLPVCLKLGKLQEVVRLNENEPGIKSEQYFQKTRDGKLILRKAMQQYVPKAVTDREKQGFSAPDASWFKGKSIEFVKRKLLQGSPRIYEFLDRQAVTGLVQEHLEGKTNRRLLIWSLLNLEHWCEAFL